MSGDKAIYWTEQAFIGLIICWMWYIIHCDGWTVQLLDNKLHLITLDNKKWRILCYIIITRICYRLEKCNTIK